METYDPVKPPDPAAWLELDELERIRLVSEYHEGSRADAPAPSPMGHAVIHSIVETQVAMAGETPAAETLERLAAEGLDRHDAVHAIGAVLAEHMHKVVAEGGEQVYSDQDYRAALENLSARNWREKR